MEGLEKAGQMEGEVAETDNRRLERSWGARGEGECESV